MINFPFFVVTFLAATASGAPIKKRINQVIDQSMVQWQAACVAAGGNLGAVCNPQAIKSFDTLLANAGPCDQQNEADNMINLAKTLNNDPAMIKFTQIFMQQPRNSPNSVSIPYCQTAPKNNELDGFFQCQFAGVDPKTFVTGPAGSPGTIPNDQIPVDPPGSCPAHPSGPIPDGTQLVNIVQSPGTPRSKSGSGSGTSKSGSDTPSNSGGSDSGSDSGSHSGSDAGSSSSSTAGDFHLENGKQAQQLNAGFAQLDENSSCKEGQNACVKSQFAQCVNGKFVSTACAATLDCFALPLVNKPGTSVACTTQSDATARIAATGAQGGITG